MKKVGNSFLVLLVLGLLCVSVYVSRTSHASFSYQDKIKVEKDLAKFFKKSNLVSFDSAHTENQIQQRSTLSFTVEGRRWEISLTPNDLRSSNYRTEKSVNGNARIPVDMDGVHTYKGNVVGLSNTDARFTIDEKTIQGVIFTQDEKFYLEPASRYSKEASNTDFVFYSERDLIKTEVGTCAVSLHDKVESAAKEFVPQKAESISALKVVELATEADFEYVNAFGGSVQANNSILGILNVVQSVYESELNLRLRVVYQHTWETQAQPYNGTDPNATLVQFRDHWNANFTNIQRDIAHLWTGRTMNNGIVGTAYVGVVCNAPGSAYGFSQKFDFEPNKFYITAHEIGHNFGAQHSDGQAGCAQTIMESAIHFLATSFCQFSRNQINTHATVNSSCLSNAVKTRFDFDGDTRADTTVYRPTGGLWYTQNSGNGAITVMPFGISSDKPTPEDFDGDGKTDVAVWRPSTGVWYILNSTDGNFRAVGFGLSTDIPAAADFDGDNKSDIVVFRPETGIWYFMNSSTGFSARAFGTNGDVPVSADYDGDAKADTAVFRPSNGVWYVQNSSDNTYTFVQFGMLGDKPVAGDFNGDGKADMNVFRPSTNVWYNLFSSSGSFRAYQFGLSGDQLTAADFDGDGKADISVFRPSTGIWYFSYSSNNGFGARAFGMNGDIAAPSAYVQ